VGKIVNRRNAIFGWAVWTVSKRAAKLKVKGATPSIEGGRPNASAVATAATVAGAAGAATFWRKRRNSGGDS
jgi:hypothetical protein